MKPTLLLFFGLLVFETVGAQSMSLTDLPVGNEVVVGFEEPYLKYRPALSVNGFDCERAGKTCAHGLGLKQILQAVDAGEPESDRLFRGIVELASQIPAVPQKRGDVKQNALIIEARAFVALAALVLVENEVSPEILGLPGPEPAISGLKEILLEPALTRFEESLSDDAVKWTGPLGSLARAIDFYLALEKAYLHYGLTDEGLFSCDIKASILEHFEQQAQAVSDFGNQSVAELEFIKILGFDIAEVLNSISYDEIQAGNWSLKVHAAVGYATLAHQRSVDGACGTLFPIDDYDHWLRRALRSAGGPDSRNRSHHWFYQTDGGRRFWAEGPYYFNYALATALPFWHTVRAQDLLDFNQDFSINDPFRAPWFLTPLEGFVDLVTPEGGLPPLEDGNKIPIEAAFLMRWNAEYGERSIGEKASWIAGVQDVLPSKDLWLNAIALPLAESASPPSATVYQDGSPIVLRRDGGSGDCSLTPDERSRPCHYILLNGETSASIKPGEGHEQSDQLQLLYYVDATSYLVDGGYDSAPGIQNSTWSDYRHHNVMTVDRAGYEGGHGGLPGAVPGLSCKTRVSTDVGDIEILFPCMYADHNPVEQWRHERNGGLDVIEASISIFPDSPESGDEITFARTVLFVDDPDTPYMIDINAAALKDPLVADEILFSMQYYGNSKTAESDATTSIRWDRLWGATDSLGSVPLAGNDRLRIEVFAIEDDYPLVLEPESIREPFIAGWLAGEGVDVERLTLSNTARHEAQTSSHTTVAFIEAQPAKASGIVDLDVLAMQPAELDARGEARFFSWQRDEETLDIAAVRSASASTEYPVTLPIAGDVTAPWHKHSALRTPGIVFDDGAGVVRLAAGSSYGFIRLVRSIDTAVESAAKPKFELLPNTPNPFRNTSRIRFSIPDAHHVRLEVFDTLGRRIALLREAVLPAGRHEVTWDAAGLPAGVYFVRLEAGERSAVMQSVVN